MTPRKKRARYKINAEQIAIDNNLPLPTSWEDTWSILDKYTQPVYVYFIGSPDLPNRVKIGKSINPWSRLKSLQTSIPLPLELYYISLDLDEKEVHRKFKHLRVSGEWFNYTQEIKDIFRVII